MNGNDITVLQLKVIPGAAKPAIVGWLDNQLKLRVNAPPEKGKANEAVIALLTTVLDIPRSQIEITRGHTSQRKTVMISGIKQQECTEKINQAIAKR
jgi:uncharacterized protein